MTDGTDGDAMASVPLPEAAEALGVSSDALRKRLQRRQVEGFRDNEGRWRVLVSVLPPPGQRPAVGRPATGADAEVVQLRIDVATLRAQLDGRDRDVARLDATVIDLRTERDRLLGLLEVVAGRASGGPWWRRVVGR